MNFQKMYTYNVYKNVESIHLWFSVSSKTSFEKAKKNVYVKEILTVNGQINVKVELM